MQVRTMEILLKVMKLTNEGAGEGWQRWIAEALIASRARATSTQIHRVLVNLSKSKYLGILQGEKGPDKFRITKKGEKYVKDVISLIIREAKEDIDEYGTGTEEDTETELLPYMYYCERCSAKIASDNARIIFGKVLCVECTKKESMDYAV